MERTVVLEAIEHTPPSHAELRKDGFWNLPLDLDEVFHHGYIEVHGRNRRPVRTRFWMNTRIYSRPT